MKYQKAIFILTILSILILIFVSLNINYAETGKIKSIAYSENKITIHLENNKTLIIFSDKFLPLKSGDKISYQGKEELYKNEKQTVIDRIIKIDEVDLSATQDDS
ncbi:MAG: hypothetical protein WC548_03350 [Candidatus Pacearchaeota archaeon]